MRPAPVADAVAAACAVAAEHGITGTEPVVLRDRANVLVHLSPAPIVARVPHVIGLVRTDPAAALARDVDLASYLAGAGIPVVEPSPELPPGPHAHAGHALTFWRYERPLPDQRHRPDEFAALLAQLHAALRDYPGPLPEAPPLLVEEIVPLLDADEALHAELFAAARRVTARLAEENAPVQPLHGDAHPGNLLRTSTGPRWLDFEDTWRGPIGWDLACLLSSQRLDGRAAVAAYPNAPELGACADARALEGITWALLMTQLGRLARADTEAALAAWRARERV